MCLSSFKARVWMEKNKPGALPAYQTTGTWLKQLLWNDHVSNKIDCSLKKKNAVYGLHSLCTWKGRTGERKWFQLESLQIESLDTLIPQGRGSASHVQMAEFDYQRNVRFMRTWMSGSSCTYTWPQCTAARQMKRLTAKLSCCHSLYRTISHFWEATHAVGVA